MRISTRHASRLGLLLVLAAQTAADEPAGAELWARAVVAKGLLDKEPVPEADGWLLSVAGLRYRISCPDPAKRRPGLVFLLHGTNGWYQGVEQEFLRPCLSAGFVVVTPRSGRYEDPAAPDKKWQEDDYPKLEALTREIASRHFVDRTRVYMIGMSNGNRGGNVVFTRPRLYTGFVGVGGGPWMIGDTALTPEQRSEMGLYLIIGSKDPYKNEADRARDLAGKAGLVDLVYREYEGLGHEIPAGCSKDAVAWLLRDRRPFLPGHGTEIRWVDEPSGPWRLVYLFSPQEEHREASKIIEWDWLSDGWMAALGEELPAVRKDIASADAATLFGTPPREPQVLLLSGAEVVLRLGAKEVREVATRASRWRKDPDRRYRSFRDSLAGKVKAALERR